MKNSLRDRLYVSTVSTDAVEVAARYGIGLELAEFCTAENMDTDFARWDAAVREKMAAADRFVFHAPFNELCPAAIDPLIVDVARQRYRQAYGLMCSYGVRKMVVHSGYVPLVYHKGYFAERSIMFWKEYLEDKPDDLILCLENVMEDEPELLRDIVAEVDDPRFRLCLDIGHAGTIVSEWPISHWIDCCAPLLGHVHAHNNYRAHDNHNGLIDGEIDMAAALRRLFTLRPDVTVTLETIETGPSMQWLEKNGFLEREDEA